jgi:hypothetical protein
LLDELFPLTAIRAIEKNWSAEVERGGLAPEPEPMISCRRTMAVRENAIHLVKGFKTGSPDTGGTFQIAKLSIEAPIEQPEGNQVDISAQVDQGILFSRMTLKAYIASTFNTPVANVELR